MGWKEKEWKKNKKRKDNQDSPSEMEREMLRMQGLILCPNCFSAYSLYQPKCPHCGETNRTHYPNKV